jgi:hypothetical protein
VCSPPGCCCRSSSSRRHRWWPALSRNLGSRHRRPCVPATACRSHQDQRDWPNFRCGPVATKKGGPLLTRGGAPAGNTTRNPIVRRVRCTHFLPAPSGHRAGPFVLSYGVVWRQIDARKRPGRPARLTISDDVKYSTWAFSNNQSIFVGCLSCSPCAGRGPSSGPAGLLARRRPAPPLPLFCHHRSGKLAGPADCGPTRARGPLPPAPILAGSSSGGGGAAAGKRPLAGTHKVARGGRRRR